jgi:PAS domain S-box-containing protein
MVVPGGGLVSAQHCGAAVAGQGLASTDEQLAALAGMPNPVFIMKAVRDPSGQIVELLYAFLNEAAAQLLGKPIEEVLGHGQCELFPSVRELGLWDAYLGVIESGTPMAFDIPWFQENGVEGSFSVTAVRFGDGVLVSAADTTKQQEAERALTESNRQYRLLAENASDVVVLTNPDRQATWVSPSVTETLGWAPEDLLGTRLADLIHPDDLAVTAASRDEMYGGLGVPAPVGGFVVRMRTKSGQYRWMSAMGTPVTDESGASVGIVGGWRDVDDLVHAQNAARRERDHLRATVDSLLDPQMLLEAVRDETGQIGDFLVVEANPAACAYHGMDRQDIVGARMLSLFPGIVEAGLLDQYARVTDTGQPAVLDGFVYANEILNAERRYDIRGARVGDGLSLTWRDVTARFSDARSLAESKEEYRLLAENASDVVMRLSTDLRFEWLSGSVPDVLGWGSSDLVGQLIDQFINPEDRDMFGLAVDGASGAPASAEFRFRRSDGTYRWVACRARVTADGDGTPVAVIGGLVDIEDRKAAEAKELDRLDDLERFQRLTVGRELRMVELKKENDYLRKLVPARGRDPRDHGET